MFFSLSTLKEFLETKLSLEELTSKLTMIGLEVESLQNPAEKLGGFITAEIKSVSKHPQADKLSLLSVDTGNEILQIVCGAPNCRAGLKGVLACVGTVIPLTGEALKKGVIRGIESQGMMCAEDELGLSKSHEIIIELPEETKVGVPFADVFNADPIIEVKATTNRADCLGVYGIARDLAAAGAGTLKPVQKPNIKTVGNEKVKIEIKTPNCPMFVGRLIKGVTNKESPAWMRERLKAFGLRPISALVDVTNYMTMMYDRPMHVFDADKMKEGLVIEMDAEGKMDALDDKSYEIKSETILIRDKNGIQSIAGIIGGVSTSVSMETKNVLLESAYFLPEAVAKAGRRLNVQTDARYRFERGIDPEGTVPLEEVAAALILEICGGAAMEPNIVGSVPEDKRLIVFKAEDVERLSGVRISQKECEKILAGLGVRKTDKGFVPPSFRQDLSITEDLVEEVLRIYGYGNIPAVSVTGVNLKPILTLKQRRNRDIIRAVATLGLNQAVTLSFSPSKYGGYFNSRKVMLANPISEGMDELRPSLLINLIEAAARNQKRGVQNIALFEAGPVFFGSDAGEQKEQIGIIRAGSSSERSWQKKQQPVSAYDVKADALSALAALGAPVENLQTHTDAPSWYHPSRSGVLKLGKNALAYFGEIHPQILKLLDVKGTLVAAEILMENLPEPKEKSKGLKAIASSDLPGVKRDFSFVKPKDITAEKLAASVRNAERSFITNVRIFDVFEDFIGIEVTFTPQDKTFTDADVEGFSKKIMEAASKIGASLRK